MADKIATRESYGKALAEFGAIYKNLVVLDADLAAATKTGTFKKAFPDRFFDCGIAENNMIAAAVGMSLCGKIPFASTFAMFAAGRSFEQIRNAIGYPHNNVKIGATHAGITVGDGRRSVVFLFTVGTATCKAGNGHQKRQKSGKQFGFHRGLLDVYQEFLYTFHYIILGCRCQFFWM